jgi:hypothetical protein
MEELIQRYESRVEDGAGASYEVSVYGAEREDGTWEGWLEFRPAAGGGPARRTGRETSQPNREALAYWASGLEPVFLEGAFARAR